MKTLKNDHWEYLRTDTWWGERGLTVFGPKVHTYIPEENCTYVLFWNCVFQEFVMKHRIKTTRPTTTINSELGDTDIQTISYNITSVIEKITQDLLVYPNPNFGIFTLEFKNLFLILCIIPGFASNLVSNSICVD